MMSMFTPFFLLQRLVIVLLLVMGPSAVSAEGVFFRIKLAEPMDQPWHAKIGGHIHVDPWSMAGAVLPVGADKAPAKQVMPGQFSPWFDLVGHAGAKIHGKHSRAGGIAEFPNITLQFSTPADGKMAIAIELATAPNEAAVVKRMEEKFTGNLTSFLVSADLKKDAAELETASQMTARHLQWAREASGGKRTAPEKLWVQTQFWSPQRPELNVQEAEVLWLLGFNLVGGTTPEMTEKFSFRKPGGHQWVEFGPALSREDCARQITEPAKKATPGSHPTLFGFSDEIACRPPIGKDPKATVNFREWLKLNKISPAELGVSSLDDVLPIESPADLLARQKVDPAAANRTFTWTTRFRHESANERIHWLNETFHQHAPPGVLTSTLVADHPYFGGSGLGMGMATENTTWGGFPLSLDWFAMARDRVVDVIGIEDWLGLDYMYGPSSTWEGFQLIGFQAAMMRSGSRGEIPIITWITPSDEKNLRLKSASALCQGGKHFFYWTYGPTATSTENYWSDLRGAYDGIVHLNRQLAGSEHLIASGKPRKTKVALLYSLSSDLWQPLGYLSMAERRLTYFSLIHDQYLVDMLTEQDVTSGRLEEYDVLYCADPCISGRSCQVISDWVSQGGSIYGSGAAGGRNEFGEPHEGLSRVFGLQPGLDVTVQKGRFDLRGALNDLPWLDEVKLANGTSVGALGLKAVVTAAGAKVTGTFKDGSPAVLAHTFGKGHARYIATCPGVSYAKDAKFVSDALKEQWPAGQREWINATAAEAGAQRLVQLSHSVVEAGIFDSAAGTALILANFQYTPIAELTVQIPLHKAPAKVISMEKGALPFSLVAPNAKLAAAGFATVAKFTLPLGWNDIVTMDF